MRRILVRASSVGLAALGVASCSLLTDLSGFSEGTAVAPDGAPVDGHAADDARDALDAADGMAGPFCASLATSPLLCEDFDDGAFGQGQARGWVPEIENEGAVALNDAAAVSTPNALRVALGASNVACRYASLYRDVDASFTSSVRFDYDIRFGHVGDPGGFPEAVPANALRLSAPGDTRGECDYYLAFGPSSAELVIAALGSSESQHLAMARGANAGGWTHISMLVESTPPGGFVTVLAGGAVAVARTAILPACQLGKLNRVYVGLLCTAALAVDVEARLDNVLVVTQ